MFRKHQQVTFSGLLKPQSFHWALGWTLHSSTKCLPDVLGLPTPLSQWTNVAGWDGGDCNVTHLEDTTCTKQDLTHHQLNQHWTKCDGLQNWCRSIISHSSSSNFPCCLLPYQNLNHTVIKAETCQCLLLSLLLMWFHKLPCMLLMVNYYRFLTLRIEKSWHHRNCRLSVEKLIHWHLWLPSVWLNCMLPQPLTLPIDYHKSDLFTRTRNDISLGYSVVRLQRLMKVVHAMEESAEVLFYLFIYWL